jgi:hypothetical protein
VRPTEPRSLDSSTLAVTIRRNFDSITSVLPMPHHSGVDAIFANTGARYRSPYDMSYSMPWTLRRNQPAPT